MLDTELGVDCIIGNAIKLIRPEVVRLGRAIIEMLGEKNGHGNIFR